MPPRVREPGEFCWINVLSPDLPATKEFFATLLGWSFPEMGGMGFLIEVAGHRQGGLFDVNAPGTPPGTKPGIGVMVRVEDADAMVERVKALGGRAAPVMEIGRNGRMVVAHGPSGANVDLWQVTGAPTSDVDAQRHGAMSWFELVTDRPDQDTTFYSQLFGWSTETWPMPGFTYTMFKRGEEFVAGMAPITDEMGDLKPFWCTYFTVDDVDATARTAESLGATITIPISEAPGVGRFCAILSPQGVEFCVMQYDAPS